MKFNFDKKEKEIIKELIPDFDFDKDLSDEEELALVEVVEDAYMYRGLDINYEATEFGIICEDILARFAYD